MLMVSDPSWPAVAYEQRDWIPAESVPISRTARNRHRGPYKSAVVPFIADLSVNVPSGVAALVEDATAEIARFDAKMGAEIAPFAAVLLRTESAASSRIENLTASARAIAEAELTGFRSGNAELIVANVATMNSAIALADCIDSEAILQMHHALMGHIWPEIAGKWREEQVWIGGGNLGPHGADFVPPHHSQIAAAITDLVAFIDRDDIPVLTHAALAHAQFETIHPFPDGNGRTGRALLHAQLRNKGLTRNVTVPVSAGLLTATHDYFDDLTVYRTGGHLAIVERVAHAAFAAVANGTRLVNQLRTVRSGWDDRIKARRDAMAWQLADLVLRHPVVNRNLIAKELGIAPENTYRSIHPLIDAGVLIESTDKKRNRIWRTPEVLDALDAFAARAGRRNPG